MLSDRCLRGRESSSPLPFVRGTHLLQLTGVLLSHLDDEAPTLRWHAPLLSERPPGPGRGSDDGVLGRILAASVSLQSGRYLARLGS